MQTSRISLIAALSENRVIGRGNRLPWRLPADLAHFKDITQGKPIVMGRRTWESLPGLLPRRTHIVVTRARSYRAQGCILASSLPEALAAAAPAPEIMMIGGAELFRQALPLAQRMYLTHVAVALQGDALFPSWSPAEWREISREQRPKDAQNPYDLAFLVLERVASRV